MIWLIFPAIGFYFLIGGMFADAFSTGVEDNDMKSALWFMFWPFMIVKNAVIVAICLVISLISLVILMIDKVYEFISSRGMKKNVS